MTAVDHQLVKRFRQDAGDRISEQRREDQVRGVTPMSNEDERHYARAVIAQILEDYARTEINLGRTPLDAETEEQYAAAVHAALFGVGRLQPLLDNAEVENIDINGYDQVFVGYSDGREEKGNPSPRATTSWSSSSRSSVRTPVSPPGPSTPPTPSSTCGFRTVRDSPPSWT